MKRLLLLSALAVSQIFATPVSINYTNLFYSTGGSQLGAYENFAVRNVEVTTDTNPGANQPNLRIRTSFNFGSNPVAAYNFAGTVITAADLFFRNSAGAIQYGIPLVGRAAGFSINGVNTTGWSNSTTAGRLYEIANPSNNDGLWRSDELGYTAIFGANGYGNGRAVLLDPRNGALNTVNNGSAPNITFNGTCTTNPCTPEFTFSFAFSNVNANLLAQFANGSLTPYFTGSTCGNDLVGIPEPSSIVLMSSALVLVGLRLRRKK